MNQEARSSNVYYVRTVRPARIKMNAHRNKLQAAILRAVSEHGEDNSFSFGELHTFHGGPPPMIAGRAARALDGHTIGHVPMGIAVKLRIDVGRVVTSKEEAEAVVICGKCEHEWSGPAVGKCPRCGLDTSDPGPNVFDLVPEHVVKDS